MNDVHCDALVVGGGVVGLAVAHALADKCTVALIEQHRRLGEELSTRNSGVIHAGLYYPPGSAKAFHCVRGNRLLYDWCAERSVTHARTSKLIIARDRDEELWLHECITRARTCGVEDLVLVGRAELTRAEPALNGVAALRSPSSGLIDAADFVRSLAFASRERNVLLALQTKALSFERIASGWRVTTRGPEGVERIQTSYVINAAGLGATKIAEQMGNGENVHYRYVKGSYFRLRSRVCSPVTPLVYPAPSEDGLGIHLTRELGGAWIAGPDTEALESPNFMVDPQRAAAFAQDLKRMLPSIGPDDLEPHFASVRPKLGPSGVFTDFRIEFERENHAAQLLGIESPGLTAALSIAATVAEQSPA